jgi:glycosyltransferase involved in cell wall biosynthesis
MKVLILTTGYPRHREDFANIYLHRLAKSLLNKGLEVHVLAPHAGCLRRDEIIDGVYIHRFRYMCPEQLQTLAYLPGIPEKIKSLEGKVEVAPFTAFMIKAILEEVKKHSIDIINAHWAIPPGLVATITKNVHKRPVLITLYGAELFPYLERKSSLTRWLIRYALCHADKIVGISDVTCDAGRRISGREDLKILPDGIDTETFNPNINDSYEIKREYGLENYFIIFSSGRMVERKGFRYLVEAMPYILKELPMTKLIIGGDGPERRSLETLVKKLGIEGNVIFPGFIPNRDFPKYMRAADVFVLPSIVDDRGDTEGSATILLEAMACGTPVVGTMVGGIPYAVKDGMGGYLVEQKSPKQLAEKVVFLLSNEKTRITAGRVGREYVKKHFCWDKIAEEYVKIFNALC